MSRVAPMSYSGDRGDTVSTDAYVAAQASAASLALLTGQPEHDVAVVLGSGWAPAADAIGAAANECSLDDLGRFRQPSVAGQLAIARSLVVPGRRRSVP